MHPGAVLRGLVPSLIACVTGRWTLQGVVAVSCTLYALMSAFPGVVMLVDIFMVAFMHNVATGADEPIANTGVGLGIAVCVLREALR